MKKPPVELTTTEFAERHLLNLLISRMGKLGYKPVKIRAHGELARKCTTARTAWKIHQEGDYYSLDFKHARTGDRIFWVELIPSNGADVIHDYVSHPDLDKVMRGVILT